MKNDSTAEQAVQKRPAHRPKGSTTSDRTAMIRARCSPLHEATYDALGGAAWLREELERQGRRLDRSSKRL